jgi:hypothetical protein
MANDKILLMAEANKLGIDGYRKMSVDELHAAISTAKGKHTAPAKGKGKASNGSTVAPSKGKGKPATAKTAAPAKGKGKPAKTAKSAPAKSKSQKTAAKATAGKGTAKRPTTGGSTAKGKGASAKPATKTRTRSVKQATGRVNIDNKAVNWKAESNVGQTGKRKEVLDALRKAKGDKAKVFDALAHRAKAFYPGKTKAEAERMLVWLIGRVAYDFVFKTGQHQPGQRAAYGTSESPQDIRRREQREEARKAQAKADRAAKRAGGSTSRAKTKTASGKGKGKSGR